jgi:L-ascorbate metabolism protein UlaG (beta-lactamase superfamily)
MDREVKIWYLYHSGFAVQTSKHFLIFDYYMDTPREGGLEKGVIDQDEIRDLDVVAFSSHSHPDHFNPCIFDWRRRVPSIRYILSDDIRTTQDAYFIKAGQTLEFDDLKVRALESTDAGVAFLVKVDGICVYHAGDLNWWHWEGETGQYNDEMAKSYKRQIDLLKGEEIDVAFVPVDPRLEDSYLLGIDYFMRSVGARLAVPMHFGENVSVCRRLHSDPRAADYREKVVSITQRGEKIIYRR